MRKTAILLTVLFLGLLKGFSQDSIVSIPDTAFLYALIEEGVDKNGDSLISVLEAESVTRLDIGADYECDPDAYGCSGYGRIISLEGIEAFNNLDSLDCSIHRIKSLDVSRCNSLVYLECSFNPIKYLKISGCTNLKYLSCTDTELRELDLSDNPNFETIIARFNQFDTLNFTNNLKLKVVDLIFSGIKHIEIAGNPSLKELICTYTRLEELDISGCSSVVKVYCSGSYIENLYVTGCSELKTLNCSGNRKLSELDLSTNRKLTVLKCDQNNISQLNLSNNPYLVDLECWSNNLEYLDLSSCPLITSLNCSQNKLIGLNITGCTVLSTLRLSDNLINSLDLSSNISLKEIDIQYNMPLKEVCVWTTPFPPAEVYLSKYGSPEVYFSIDCLNEIVYIPDTSFLYALIDEGVDTNGDSLISYDEAEARTYLDISKRTGEGLCTGKITDLTGIGTFLNLDTLDCSCNQLTTIDVSANTALKSLICAENILSDVDISNNLDLTSLNISLNDLTNLDVSNNPELKSLHLWGNHLTFLDISQNSQLESLFIGENPDLTEVCVWTIPFPPPGFGLYREGSPNICFDTICNSSCEYTAVEILKNDHLSIYPNPANTVLNIQQLTSIQIDIQITSLNGQIVYNEEFEGTNLQIDLSAFKKGIYFITLWSKDLVSTRKILKL